MKPMPLWLAAQPLVLASKSAARRALLEAAGIPIEIEPADIDERAVEARAGSTDAGRGRGAAGAREGARRWRRQHPDRMVLGADQTLALGDAAIFQGGRPRRRARAACGAARPDPHAAFGGGGGAGRRGGVRACRCGASDHARVLGRFSRPLSRCGRRRGDRERRRLSARRPRRATVRARRGRSFHRARPAAVAAAAIGCGAPAIWRQ